MKTLALLAYFNAI